MIWHIGCHKVSHLWNKLLSLKWACVLVLFHTKPNRTGFWCLRDRERKEQSERKKYICLHSYLFWNVIKLRAEFFFLSNFFALHTFILILFFSFAFFLFVSLFWWTNRKRKNSFFQQKKKIYFFCFVHPESVAWCEGLHSILYMPKPSKCSNRNSEFQNSNDVC